MAVCSVYEERRRRAAGMELGGNRPGSTGGTWHGLEIQDGDLCWDGEALSPASLYSGADVTVTATAHPGALGLTVEVYDKSGVIFTKSSAFPLVNLPEWSVEEALPESSGRLYYTD